ncbi:serine/arginine repetitive matrix protein 1 [Senna tora]|uniref:Serine/arginine repetitive matrix protein 1 n=1 Tax=Senna tora TaxID=362788 RepID=A0A834WLL3_9FABA|nr:serine/arginine repetitive matrix protein 1 [Senna tora]
MGKERYWAPTSFKRRGVIVETKAKQEEEEAQTSSGCMCAFFHFFDFHPFNHFSIQHQHQHQQPPPLNSSASCLPQDLTIPKGVEAPRNSLEILEDGDGTTANTMHCNASKDENLKIPIKSIQFIKTSGSSRSGRINGNVINDLSPGTKTPTLVARLMGLDLLPDAQSPSSSISSSSSSASSSSFSNSCLSTPNPHHLKPQPYIIKTKPRHNSTKYCENSGIKIAASRSLPETPRISSARRSDVEHHRLSLQINKENNVGVGDTELELPRFSFSKRKLDEQSNSSRSPSHYARQIVKQLVKESVSRRKVGTDITNTITTTSVVKHRESESDVDSVSQFIRSKKSARTTTTTTTTSVSNKVRVDHHEELLPSCSPRLRFVDPKNIKPKPKQELVQQQVPKCKKAANERFSTPKLKNKQEESFVRSQYSPSRPNDVKPKNKRSHHPLVSKTVHNLNLRPLNTVPQKQQVCEWEEPKCSSQLSSGSRQRNKQETTSSCRHGIRESNDVVEDKSNGAAGSIIATTRADDGPEFQYVTGILSRTKLLVKDTVTTPHPLDPSIFHHLEQHYHHHPTTISPLGLRCNRRLLFDLVDGILLEMILGPFVGGKEEYGGSQLAERVWESIGRFPSAKNCEVLEDIDALIEMKEMTMMMEEKEEGKAMMVAEIEGDIVDTLVHETVMELGVAGPYGEDGVVLTGA